jgi:hypothetical protein
MDRAAEGIIPSGLVLFHPPVYGTGDSSCWVIVCSLALPVDRVILPVSKWPCNESKYPDTPQLGVYAYDCNLLSSITRLEPRPEGSYSEIRTTAVSAHCWGSVILQARIFQKAQLNFPQVARLGGMQGGPRGPSWAENTRIRHSVSHICAYIRSI